MQYVSYCPSFCHSLPGFKAPTDLKNNKRAFCAWLKSLWFVFSEKYLYFVCSFSSALHILLSFLFFFFSLSSFFLSAPSVHCTCILSFEACVLCARTLSCLVSYALCLPCLCPPIHLWRCQHVWVYSSPAPCGRYHTHCWPRLSSCRCFHQEGESESAVFLFF